MTGILLVTGGSRGIGAATARLAAQNGYAVAINYRAAQDQAQALAAEIEREGGRVIAVQADVASQNQVEAMFRAVDAFGPLGALVNSAGISLIAPTADLEQGALERLLAINVIGTMLCCREAVRRMSTRRGGQGGAIVNVSSMAAKIGGRPGRTAYAASKGAIDSFTVGLAKEVAREGIRVNALRPGMTMTDMTDAVRRDPAALCPHRRDHRDEPLRRARGDGAADPVAALRRGLVHLGCLARRLGRRLHRGLGRRAPKTPRAPARTTPWPPRPPHPSPASRCRGCAISTASCRRWTSRGLDGIVATLPQNVFYLTSFNGVARKADEPRPYAVILSRAAPEHPVLVVADYYLATFLAQPSWVEDIRPYRAVMMPLDLPPRREDIDRFIPSHGAGVAWLERARQNYSFDMAGAVRGALRDLKLERGRVAFDDMGFGFRLGLEHLAVVDGYDPLMFARAVKTAPEMRLLERATRLNEAAIGRTIDAWQQGATWRDLNRAYAQAVADLGGFVRDPGGMVWGHPRGADPAICLSTGLEDDEVAPGTHVMFDCHGTLDLYCWDGGKTWVVEGEPEGGARQFAKATAAVADDLLDAMRPGVRISQLHARARASLMCFPWRTGDDAGVASHASTVLKMRRADA